MGSNDQLYPESDPAPVLYAEWGTNGISSTMNYVLYGLDLAGEKDTQVNSLFIGGECVAVYQLNDFDTLARLAVEYSVGDFRSSKARDPKVLLANGQA